MKLDLPKTEFTVKIDDNEGNEREYTLYDSNNARTSTTLVVHQLEHTAQGIIDESTNSNIYAALHSCLSESEADELLELNENNYTKLGFICAYFNAVFMNEATRVSESIMCLRGIDPTAEKNKIENMFNNLATDIRNVITGKNNQEDQGQTTKE